MARRLAIALAICWLLPACEKDSPTGDPVPRVPEVALAGFPANSDFILHCEFNRAGPDTVREWLAKKVPDPIRRCAFNPLSPIRSVTVAGTLLAGGPPVVITGIARPELASCLGKLGSAPLEHERLTGVDVDGETRWLGWLSNDAFIVGPRFERAFVEKHLALETSLAPDAPVVQLVNAPSPSARGGQCALATTSGELGKTIGGAFEGLISAHGRVGHRDRNDGNGEVRFSALEVSALLRFATPAQAEAAEKARRRDLDKMGSLVKPSWARDIVERMTVKRFGAELSLEVALDETTLASAAL